jgi:lysozyme family protein
MSIEAIIDGIILREGREYTNRPSDKGGPTKYGITLGDWQLYTGKPATPADIEALTEEQARPFFRWRYILQPGFDTITDEWLQIFIIDTGVLEGRETAVKMLQKILGVKADGVFGPITRAALANYHDLDVLKRTMLVTRMHHLIGCVLSDKRIPREYLTTTNLEHLHGWWNRVASFLGV